MFVLRDVEIEGDAALVAVESQVIGALTSDIRGAEMAGVVPFAGLFNFDHGCPQVAQDHGTVGPGQYTRKIDDDYIREGSFHGTSLSSLFFFSQWLAMRVSPLKVAALYRLQQGWEVV